MRWNSLYSWYQLSSYVYTHRMQVPCSFSVLVKIFIAMYG